VSIRKIFQLEKGKYSSWKEINIPNRKRKSFQLEKGFGFQLYFDVLKK
jgi:hypothetical protein